MRIRATDRGGLYVECPFLIEVVERDESVPIFLGIHYDIEIGGLPEWTEDPNAISNSYLDIIEEVATLCSPRV